MNILFHGINKNKTLSIRFLEDNGHIISSQENKIELSSTKKMIL